MSPSLQPAPQPDQSAAAAAAAYQGSTYSTSGSDGGAPPTSQAGALGAQLSNDSRLKLSLHVLILVLPLTILIFGEALRHPKADIELPIIQLKLRVESVLPIFLMVLSYMLHRAMRYARIVLWNIVHAPDQMTEVARIALDDTEAYKMNSAYYEEVLDPMAAALMSPLSNLKRQWPRLVAWISLASFNVMISLVLYGIILLMLVIMCLYVSTELLSVAASLNAFDFRPHWPIEPTRAIDILILGLSTLLLFLAWLNAAWIALIALLAIVSLLAILLFGGIILAWQTVVFAPVRFVLRTIYDAASQLREKHCDRLFAKEMAAYKKRKDAPNDERIGEYRSRLRLFDAAKAFRSRVRDVEYNFGRQIFDGGRTGVDTGSEWSNLLDRYGFTNLSLCAYLLIVFAQRASIKFVTSDAWRLHKRLEGFLDAYGDPPDDALLAIIGKAKARSLSDTEREQAATQIRARNATISPRGTEIRRLYEHWQRRLTKLISGKSTLYSPGVDIFELSETGKKYFEEPESKNTAFNEPVPVRGAGDSKIVTYLLGLLGRIADA
jgi:membrane protein implicated in regulation of membrane protease activity